jgi:hypothetical protein
MLATTDRPRRAAEPRRLREATRRPLGGLTRGARLLIALIALLALGVGSTSWKPLRASIEQRTNQRLIGYQTRLHGADFRPWNFSIALDRLVVRQEAHPEPAVLDFPRFECSVQWLALLRLRLVGEVDVYDPEQDEEQGFFHKFWERIAGGIAHCSRTGPARRWSPSPTSRATFPIPTPATCRWSCPDRERVLQGRPPRVRRSNGAGRRVEDRQA